jgi:hypothetical protein
MRRQTRWRSLNILLQLRDSLKILLPFKHTTTVPDFNIECFLNLLRRQTL